MAGVLQKVEAVGNKVNSAVYRCLRARKREDRDSAYDDLVGFCWVACRPLYAPVDGGKTSRTDRTRAFIERELHTVLGGLKERSDKEIDRLALNNELRWVARKVHNRLVDAIRRSEAKKRRQERGDALG